MKRVRISGLVKIMNQVRESLSRGIAPEEEEAFRNFVKGSVQQVEQICKEYEISPEMLPSPTFRAYRYLKELDLKVLPVAKEAPTAETGQLRIRNLISVCQAIQQQLAELAMLYSQLPKKTSQPLPIPSGLKKQIRTLVKSVQAALQSAGSSESSLSNQSQRAYLWARYLSQDSHLQEHVTTLQDIYAEIERASKQSKGLKKRLTQPIQIELYNLPAIYKVKQLKDGLTVQVHEGFVGAPDEVIKALVMATLVGKDASDRKGGKYLDTVKAYSNSHSFRQIDSHLNVEKRTTSQGSRGQHFDLQAVFDSVNQTYFAGEMAKPNLIWNKTLTHRKFGHYQASSDTIMISISLDSASIPSYVVEFVMFHELLHKQIGTSKHRGRQYAHTPAFREAEARFLKKQQAEAVLNELARKLQKRKS
jgi:hypothetical protein